MAYWLVKTEPEEYSFEILRSKGRDVWNGVRNFKALKNIRSMQVYDLLFIYHTGKEKAIVGVAEAVSFPYQDPNEDDPRFVVIDVAPLYYLASPFTLKEVKENPAFLGWELINQPRLSVMGVIPEHWQLVHDLAGMGQSI